MIDLQFSDAVFMWAILAAFLGIVWIVGRVWDYLDPETPREAPEEAKTAFVREFPFHDIH